MSDIALPEGEAWVEILTLMEMKQPVQFVVIDINPMRISIASEQENKEIKMTPEIDQILFKALGKFTSARITVIPHKIPTAVITRVVRTDFVDMIREVSIKHMPITESKLYVMIRDPKIDVKFWTGYYYFEDGDSLYGKPMLMVDGKTIEWEGTSLNFQVFLNNHPEIIKTSGEFPNGVDYWQLSLLTPDKNPL